MQLTVQHGPEVITLQVEPDGDGWRVLLPDESEHHITACRLPGDVLQIADGERVFRVPFANTSRGLEFSHAGEAFLFTAPTSRKAGSGRKPSSGALTAPMSGVVSGSASDGRPSRGNLSTPRRCGSHESVCDSRRAIRRNRPRGLF